MSDGTRAKGDYSNSGVSALVEAGRHINLGNDWFAKPSAQVSAARIEGADYRLDNGMEADGDHIDSLRTKLGVSAGRSIKLERDVRVRPYASVAVIHEFASNDDNVRVNGNSLNNDLSGSGLEFGMGVTVSLSESMRLDAGVDYFKGNDVEQPVAARLGWSYQW
jgi:outer membrane autotransporter protein